jgi:hypothetical protein
MRLVALTFTAIFVAASATAGQSASSPPDGKASPEAAATTGQKDDPNAGPVSLDKIRGELAKPMPAIRGLSEQEVHFEVQIQERQKIEELLATLDFKTGPTGTPTYPGGWAALDQQKVINNAVESPLTQPYAAFSTSELLTIAIENLTAKYLGGRVVDAVTSAERARAERAARAEVAQAMGDFCAGQPNHGAGLQACDINPSDR